MHQSSRVPNPAAGVHGRGNALLHFILIAFLLCDPFSARAEQGQEGRAPIGPPFSDSKVGVAMPEQWRQQPVEHDPALKDFDLVVNLDQSTGPLLRPLVEQFARSNKLHVHINAGTCGVTNRLLFQKQLDLGTFCCPPGEEDRLPGLRFHTLGITPLIIIVHPSNPLDDISFVEAQRVFMGEIRHWKELWGSRDKVSEEAIQPVAFIHCKKRPGHWRLLLDNEDLFSARIVSVLTIPDMIYAVASNPQAIGFDTPYTALRYYREEKGAVKYLRVDGLDPLDLEQVAAHRYPLYQTITIATWENGPSAKNEVARLVSFLQDYLDKNGAEFDIVGAKRLRRAGWKFRNAELVGDPDMALPASR